MKVTVNRSLKGGVYYVSFKVGEFTPEERERMEKFGVPGLTVLNGPPTNRAQGVAYLNSMNPSNAAGFGTEIEAKGYETKILDQMRKMMASLRDKKDDFTSAEEVNI